MVKCIKMSSSLLCEGCNVMPTKPGRLCKYCNLTAKGKIKCFICGLDTTRVRGYCSSHKESEAKEFKLKVMNGSPLDYDANQKKKQYKQFLTSIIEEEPQSTASSVIEWNMED